MTPSPVSPTPAIGAINVSGGTGNWSASGQSVASGVPAGAVTGSFSGPHFIEEQELSITYFRYPLFQFNNVSPQDVSLSSTMPVNSTVSGTVSRTMLAYKLTASIKALKSYDRFDTSSYQQPQKFQILATSADALGNTYGDVPQGACGLAGQIITSQKFYNRRPWESSDTEFDQSADGYSFYFEPSALTNGTFSPATNNYLNQNIIFGNFWEMDTNLVERFPELGTAMSWGGGARPYNRNFKGRLTGPYKSPNDTGDYVIELLDDCGRVASNGHHLHDPEIAVGGTWKDATGELNVSSIHYCPNYDRGRHDYS
jgi:hypothetical protein